MKFTINSIKNELLHEALKYGALFKVHLKSL